MIRIVRKLTRDLVMALSRRDFIGAAAVGAMALATPAIAQDAQVKNAAYVSPIVQAGDYGEAGPDNIGIMIYFGQGNGVTKDQVGEFVIRKLQERAALRGMNINPQYFILDADWQGVAVGYHMGGVSVDSQDLKSAVQPSVIDHVLDDRDRTAKLLAQVALQDPDNNL